MCDHPEVSTHVPRRTRGPEPTARRRWLGAVLKATPLLLAVGAISFFGVGRASGSRSTASTVRVIRVMDGGALYVRLGGGRNAVVRLLGISVPRGTQCAAPEAASLLRRLTLGRPVTLHGDPSVALGQHARRFEAYVDLGRVDVGKRLVAAGFARASYRQGVLARLGGYGRAQSVAQRQTRGLWRFCPGTMLPRLPSRPVPNAGRHIVVRTQAGLRVALAQLRDGDHVLVEPGVYAGQYEVRSKELRRPAEVVFRPGAKLVGGAREGDPPVYTSLLITDSRNVWIHGGEFVDPEGDGMKIDDSSDIVVDGARAHDTGDQCFLVVANTRDQHDIWLRNVEAYRCGSDRGGVAREGGLPAGYWRRGIHGIYYGAAENGHSTYGGAIINYYGHDSCCGSLLQIGDAARRLVVSGATLVRSHSDPSDYAGNAINFWGDRNRDVVIANSVIYDTYGHALHVSASSESGPDAGVVRSLMYGDVGEDPAVEHSVLRLDGVWHDDPLLDQSGVPTLTSPAVGRADPSYLSPYDRTGRPRTMRTLGAFEPVAAAAHG